MTDLPQPDATARNFFGERLTYVSALAELLAGEAVVRGLIGPREVSRLWDRHLLNCAVIGELLPRDAVVVDVGTGAGLPGLVLAVHRPDLRIVLLEPLLRRTTFLIESVTALGLADRVTVVRGRADERAVRDQIAPASWVTARAVAPLDRLARWCLPLLAGSGRLLAMKGDRAARETADARSVLTELGAHARIVECGRGVLDPPARVVVVERD